MPMQPSRRSFTKKPTTKKSPLGSNKLLKDKPKGLLDDIQSIVDERQYKKIDGQIVDVQTASVIMQVYNAVNDKNKAKMEKLPVKKLTAVAWKIMDKHSK